MPLDYEELISKLIRLDRQKSLPKIKLSSAVIRVKHKPCVVLRQSEKFPDVLVLADPRNANPLNNTYMANWRILLDSEGNEAHIGKFVRSVKRDYAVKRFRLLAEPNQNQSYFTLLVRELGLTIAGAMAESFVDRAGPVIIQNGVETLFLKGHPDDYKFFYEILEKNDVLFDINYIGDVYFDPLDLSIFPISYKVCADTVLTEDEELMIKKALKEGYFDVNRKISLQELAGILDIKRTTLRYRMRNALQKIIVEYYYRHLKEL